MEKPTAYTLFQIVMLVEQGFLITNYAVNSNVQGTLNVQKTLRHAMLLRLLLLLAIIIIIIIITTTFSISCYCN